MTLEDARGHSIGSISGDNLPFSVSGREFSTLVSAVLDHLCPYVDSVPSAGPKLGPLSKTQNSFVLSPPPELPGELSTLLGKCMDSFNTGFEVNSPYMMAYFVSGTAPYSALAELITMVLNRYVVGAIVSPGMAGIENGVIKWMAELFDLGPKAHGVLTTGGSMAILTAVLGVREWFKSQGGSLDKATVYVMDHTHHAFEKALYYSGIPLSSLRTVKTVRGRVSVADLEKQIQVDVGSGFRPMLLVGTAGTTDAGIVDPLEDLGRLAKKYHMWYHVDGCYGAFYILTSRGQKRLKGIQMADTISLDPHKTLYVPFGTGALVMRDAIAFTGYLSTTPRAEMMNHDRKGVISEFPDFLDMSPELSREARGLRIWLPLHCYGVGAYRDMMDKALDLTEYAYLELERMGFEMVYGKPDLGVVVARLPGDQKYTDELISRLGSRQEFWFSVPKIDDQTCLRLTFVNWRTEKRHVDEVLDIIREEIASIGFGS